MDFVGVINKNKSVMDKLKIAKKYNKLIDSHVPLLSGENLEKYTNVFDKNNIIDIIDDFEEINDIKENENIVIQDYISSDHESIGFDEALLKKEFSHKIMVREGALC